MPPFPVPYKHFSLMVDLSPAEAADLISAAISPARYTVWETPVPNRKRFHGEASAQGFTISIPQDLHNSFAVFIFGRFIPTEKGVLVDVRLTFHPLVLVAVCLVWGILTSVFLISLLFSGGFSVRAVSVPLTILVGSYLFSLFVYGFEATQLEAFIKQLFAQHRH